MNKLVYVLAVFLIASIFLAATPMFAQTPGKKPLPQVPLTYPGDTDQTITRRAQWIEGAKKEGTLNWWGILQPPEGGKVIAEFNKVYPFITVAYWRGKGEEIAAKLETGFSGGSNTADVSLGGEPYNYPRWRKKGFMDKFTNIVPMIERIDKNAYSRYGDWFQPGNQAISPQYNTKLIPAAEAPKSWEDLLNPKWKGQIGLTTDMKVWTTVALSEGGWGVEKTESFLRRLKQQQLIWAPSHTTGHSLLISGEFKIMAEEYVYHVFRSQSKGAPVDWCRVKPVMITGPSFTFPTNAPHPNSARLFLEWLFSPQGLSTYEKITNFGAAHSGAGTRLSNALEGLPLVYRTEEGEIKAMEMDLNKKLADLLGVTPSGD